MSSFFLRVSRIIFIALLFSIPIGSNAATLFGEPIIPEHICPGTAPSWGYALEILQNIINAAVVLAIFLAVLWITYAGFSMMTSGGVAQARTIAKTRLLNTFIGLAVLLASWLMVDFVMKMIYNPSATFQGIDLGPWNSILAPGTDTYCIKKSNPDGLVSGYIAVIMGTNTPGGSVPGSNGAVGVAKGLCADSNTACSVAVMQKEGLTEAQAKAMSCIAVTESSGGANKGDSGTGAQGLFQITGQNWRNPAYHSGSCSAQTSRLNNDCNRQAAVLMFKDVGYQPWTGKCNNRSGCGKVSYGQYWNPNAVACVNKYNP